MAEFVQYELEDGTKVYFETADSALVSVRSENAEVVDGGLLGDRLTSIAMAAGEVSRGLRTQLGPDEIELTFAVKMSGSVGWWWFGRADGEASIQVKASWTASPKIPKD